MTTAGKMAYGEKRRANGIWKKLWLKLSFAKIGGDITMLVEDTIIWQMRHVMLSAGVWWIMAENDDRRQCEMVKKDRAGLFLGLVDLCDIIRRDQCAHQYDW
jgi:hypothetical protein